MLDNRTMYDREETSVERLRFDCFSGRRGDAWAMDRCATDGQKLPARAGTLFLRHEMLGQVGKLLGFPAPPASPEVVDDASHRRQLSRSHRSQIFVFQQKQSRRASRALQFADQLREVLLEQPNAPLKRGQGLG